MDTINTNSKEFKALSVKEQARLIWQGMKKLNPASCAKTELIVRRNMICAGFYQNHKLN